MPLPQALLAALSKANIEVDENGGITFPPEIRWKTPYSFAKLSGSSVQQINFTKERWSWFNEHLFGGVLTMPDFEISKATTAMKTLGLWYPYKKKLVLAGKLFKLPTDSQALGTLVHEMAHQYESEITPRPNSEDAHGPTWQGIMRDIGQPTGAKYTGPSQRLYDTEQLTLLEKVKKERPSVDTVYSTLITYCFQVDLKKKKQTPFVIVGEHTQRRVRAADAQTLVPGFTELDLKAGQWRWVAYSSLTVLDPFTARLKMPESLRDAKAKAYAALVRDNIREL
jgi:hypothetical protein